MRTEFGLAALLGCLIAAPASAGIGNLQIVSASSASDSTTVKVVDVLCPPGTFALGGGAVPGGDPDGRALAASHAIVDLATGDPIGWTATMYELFPYEFNWNLQVRAICGTAPGLYYVAPGIAVSNSDSFRELTRTCPAGKAALAGGFQLGGAFGAVGLFSSWPDDSATGYPHSWTFKALEVIPSSGNWSLFGGLICADEDALLFEVTDALSSSAKIRGATLYCPERHVATAGGTRSKGGGEDWIYRSDPDMTGEAWQVLLQRQSEETISRRHEYAVICPEPGAPTLGALAVAAVIAIGRRRHDSDVLPSRQ